MKRTFVFALMLSLFSLPAFAGSKSQYVTLGTASKVGTTTLPAGDYKLTYTGTGANVQAEMVQKVHDHPARVTFNATFTPGKNPYVAVMLNDNGGVETVESIQLPEGKLVPAAAPSSGN